MEGLGYDLDVRGRKKKARFLIANLNEKVEDALRLFEKCELCEHKCRVGRIKGQLGV